jgi:WhiB family redox-sensing transcriptional regulator
MIDDLASDEQQAWMERAACRGMDPALFFPLSDEEAEAGLSVCRTCPVREECLGYALAARERYGIWGGTTERERKRILRRSA